MKKTYLIIAAVILLSFGLSCCLYPLMPERMASHWNIKGEVDGYASRFVGLFLLPLIALAILALFWFIPKIDPLKENIEKFRKYFDNLIVFIVFFLVYIYCLTIAWNLGCRFNMGQLMAPALALIFFYCGVLIGKTKRNYFIGIRTPWTLSSDVVWEKTHQAGAKMFKTAGSLALLGVLFPDQAIFFIVIPILAAAVFSVFYSYLVFRRETKKDA